MELLISTIIGLLVCEAYVWLPKLSNWLLERAIRRLPPENQERCREEWQANLNDLPNTLVRLLHAFSFNIAAHKITVDDIDSKCDAISGIFKWLSKSHADFIEQNRALKMRAVKFEESIATLGPRLQKAVQYLEASEIPVSYKTQFVTAFDKRGRELIQALEMDWKSFRALTDSFSTYVDQAEDLTRMVLEKHAHTIELVRKRKLSLRASVTALEDVLGDLKKARTTRASLDDEVEMRQWSEETVLEQQNVQAAIQRVFDHFRTWGV